MKITNNKQTIVQKKKLNLNLHKTTLATKKKKKKRFLPLETKKITLEKSSRPSSRIIPKCRRKL